MSNSQLIEIWNNAQYDTIDIAPQEKVFFKEFLARAKTCERILEVGSGEGRMLKILESNGVTAQFYSIDITNRVRGSLGNKVIGDARKPPFQDNSFDMVYSLGVVEHFPETGAAIREHARVVRRGGYVLITTPHIGHYTVFRISLFYIKRQYRMGSFEIIKGRNLTLSCIKQYVDQADLCIMRIAACGRILPSVLGYRVDFLCPRSKLGNYLYCLARKR